MTDWMISDDKIILRGLGADPHQQKICLFRQNFCHHKRSTSADGLLRLDKFWPKRTKLQAHRRQNLSWVKIGQNRLSKQNFVYLVINMSKSF